MIEHLARNWGNWASVAGLVFSILAFVFSKRASKAAADARDSILRRTLGQEMMEAEHMASEIARFLVETRAKWRYSAPMIFLVESATARIDGMRDCRATLRRISDSLETTSL
jgi:hypothetical protein